MKRILLLLIILKFCVICSYTSYSQNIKEYCYIDVDGVEKSVYYYQRSIVFEDTILIPFYSTINFNRNIYEIEELEKEIYTGLDCSRWQRIIPWENITSDKYKFIFIKATQGVYTDPSFYENWKNCKIPKGAYCFFNPRMDGFTQGKYFIQALKNAGYKKGDLLPVIDVEYSHSWKRYNKRTAARHLKQLLDYIETEIGEKPIIYTNANFWNIYVSPYFQGNSHQYPLWIANYYTTQPKLPRDWDEYAVWQFTDKGRIEGSNTYWDMNFLNGNDLKIITY